MADFLGKVCEQAMSCAERPHFRLRRADCFGLRLRSRRDLARDSDRTLAWRDRTALAVSGVLSSKGRYWTCLGFSALALLAGP